MAPDHSRVVGRLLQRVVFLAAALLVTVSSAAAEPRYEHGISFFHELKYPADFTHFDYLNPDSPKGGVLVLSTQRDFNTLTIFTDFARPGDGCTIPSDGTEEIASMAGWQMDRLDSRGVVGVNRVIALNNRSGQVQGPAGSESVDARRGLCGRTAASLWPARTGTQLRGSQPFEARGLPGEGDCWRRFAINCPKAVYRGLRVAALHRQRPQSRLPCWHRPGGILRMACWSTAPVSRSRLNSCWRTWPISVPFCLTSAP